ncbi:MAG: hypothetical protein ACE5DR_05275, partial [Thermodesulfobacteriota bacterium]
WFHRSAMRGNVKARASLGLMYAYGKGIQQDYTKAYMWLSLAAEGKVDNAGAALESIETKMTPEEINEAKKRAEHLKKSPGTE